jgi:hypothetical protein
VAQLLERVERLAPARLRAVVAGRLLGHRRSIGA